MLNDIINIIILDAGTYIILSLITGSRDGEKFENFKDFLNMLKTGWKREI